MNIAILGGGESGVGAALLAKHKNQEVFLSEYGSIKDHYRQALQDHKVDFEESGHTIERLLKADLVVKSPGIPEKATVIQKLREADVRIVSEIEFAFKYTDAKIIAITGSNGKTTTTSLIYQLLKNGGYDVGLAGNIGHSWARQLVSDDHEYWVLELSSFQLDDVMEFSPDIAVVLNITADHLDRYGYDIGKYAEAKMKIAAQQKSFDHLIINQEDRLITDRLQNIKSSIHKVSNQHKKVLSKDGATSFEINLKGTHNIFNANCAVQVCEILGMSYESIQQGLSTFQAIEHRLEELPPVSGLRFINDSKATNIDAVQYALAAMDEEVIWIVGGVDKGNDYDTIRSLVDEKVNHVICLGLDNTKLIDAFGNDHVLTEAKSMKAAVEQAFELGKSGQVVLLSPACASFDLFKNYEDRGLQFKKEVERIRETAQS